MAKQRWHSRKNIRSRKILLELKKKRASICMICCGRRPWFANLNRCVPLFPFQSLVCLHVIKLALLWCGIFQRERERDCFMLADTMTAPPGSSSLAWRWGLQLITKTTKADRAEDGSDCLDAYIYIYICEVQCATQMPVLSSVLDLRRLCLELWSD